MKQPKHQKTAVSLWLVLAMTSLLPVSPYFESVSNAQDVSQISVRHRSSSLGNEAFTEPVETIQVACAESGIIENVNVQRGDTVQAGQLMVELDKRVLNSSLRLAQAKAKSSAKLKAARIEFQTKSTNYEKLVGLIRNNAATPKEVESAKSSAEVAQQNVEAILEEVAQFELETKRIQSQLEQRSVRSPIAGVVTDVRKKSGEYVAVSDPHLVTVVRLDLLRVVFYLPTQRAANIKKGDMTRLVLTETNQQSSGTVEYVAPITNADSGRVRVEVLIDNPDRKFRSGVRCQILDPVDHKAKTSSLQQDH